MSYSAENAMKHAENCKIPLEDYLKQPAMDSAQKQLQDKYTVLLRSRPSNHAIIIQMDAIEAKRLQIHAAYVRLAKIATTPNSAVPEAANTEAPTIALPKDGPPSTENTASAPPEIIRAETTPEKESNMEIKRIESISEIAPTSEKEKNRPTKLPVVDLTRELSEDIITKTDTKLLFTQFILR